MKQKSIWFIPIIFAIAVLSGLLRLYKIDGPIADWHSWRQADTAAVARNYLRDGIDLLRPRYDDLSNIQSGKDNPQGWRMVEFPMYQGIAASLSGAAPMFPIETWLRILAIAASVVSVVLTSFVIASQYGPVAGILTGLCFAVLPYNIYYGRTILPDTFMLAWPLASLYCLTRLIKSKTPWVWLLVAGVFGSVGLLAKPMAGFLLFPLPYLLWKKYSFSPRFFMSILAYSLICVLPLIWWRGWITQFPEGIASSEWLLNQNNIRFKGAWFSWLFAKRLGELMLGHWGLIPFGLGLLTLFRPKQSLFLLVWLLGGLVYLTVFATGNVQHDYYQILLIPIVSSVVGMGMNFLLYELTQIPRGWRMVVGIVSIVFALAFSWQIVRTYYWVNRPEIIEAGRAADKLIPTDAKVIASYNGDTTFLYQTGRKGWPLGFEIDKKIAMGATHYVTISPRDEDGETRALASEYTVLVRNDKYAIIDLTKPRVK